MQLFVKAGCQSGVTYSMDYKQLVKDCVKNKPIAQQKLYNHFAPVMLGLCYRYTKSVKDAEDVLQEGFIKVFVHLNKYKADGELGAWIRRIMVTTALNYLKKNSRYRTAMVFTETSLHPVSDENPELQLTCKELGDLIRQLPTGYQTIFNLYAVEGYTHIEIGQLLGISEGTSKSQYARARHFLIKWIGNYSSSPKKDMYAGK